MEYKIDWKVEKFTKLVDAVNELIMNMVKFKIDTIVFSFEFDDDVTMYRIYGYPLFAKFKVSYYKD